jgi:hypothetical protein
MYESAAKISCHRSSAAFAARYKIDGKLHSTPGVSAVRVCSEVINGKLRAPGVSAVRVCSEVMDAMDAE